MIGIRATVVWLAAAIAAGAPLSAGEDVGAAKPFRITIVDDQTGRGVPLVELRTVNQISYFTDSNGVVAFDEPGLLGTRVHFEIASHGYEFPKDGFGYAGKALDAEPGGEATLKIKRINIAERLYRVTGGGIYRDSLLTGVPAPLQNPVIDGLVLGQDSVFTVVYHDEIHWFWGDTSRPAYPLGNFHTPSAVSKLPGEGGLDPAKGVDLTYYLDEHGFAKATCKMPGSGPTWITGIVVLTDAQGHERMFANYAKIEAKAMKTYERGAVEWDDEKAEFVKRAVFEGDPETTTGETLSGHTFLHEDDGVEYVYYCNPLPLTRLPADPEKLIDEDAVEVFTCLEPGATLDDPKFDRDADGRLRYSWRKDARRFDQRRQIDAAKAGTIKPEEGLVQFRDPATAKTVLAHGGSVYWNEFRKRWTAVFVEVFGTSMLGEIWFAEADSPVGPWTFARKVVTHDDYSFYNPKQHTMFDQDGGRVIYFEGTYTKTFSGNKRPTPRYDYNQVMYRLTLDDPRLSLPVAVYQTDATSLATGPKLGGAVAGKEVAFYAPDRPGEGTTAAEIGDGERIFLLPADSRVAETTPIYEYCREGSEQRTLSIDPEREMAGWRRTPDPVGRVWKNPGPSRAW